MVFKLAHVLDDIWNAGLQVEVGYVGVEVDVDLSEKAPWHLADGGSLARSNA